MVTFDTGRTRARTPAGGRRSALRGDAGATRTGRVQVRHALQLSSSGDSDIQPLGSGQRIQRACPKAPTGIGRWEAPTCAKEGPEAVSGSWLRFCQDSTQLIDGHDALLATTIADAKDVEYV